MPDGYRDVQLSVIFRGAGDLLIIGEVQVHDAELHSLKQKVACNLPVSAISSSCRVLCSSCRVLCYRALVMLLLLCLEYYDLMFLLQVIM